MLWYFNGGHVMKMLKPAILILLLSLLFSCLVDDEDEPRLNGTWIFQFTGDLYGANSQFNLSKLRDGTLNEQYYVYYTGTGTIDTDSHTIAIYDFKETDELEGTITLTGGGPNDAISFTGTIDDSDRFTANYTGYSGGIYAGYSGTIMAEQ
jgi:hypothetical protein